MLATLDASVSSALEALRSPALDAFMRTITHVGDMVALALGGLILVMGLTMSGRRADARLAAASLIVGLIGFLPCLKLLAGRPRPPAELALVEQPWTASFPSGHAFGALVLALLVIWATSRLRGSAWWTAMAGLATAVALVVGVSRAYLGVHWATDVIGGWVLAAAWVGATLWVAKRLAGRFG